MPNPLSIQDIPISEGRARRVLEQFGLHGGRLRREIFIPGSPERCLARVVAEDGKARLWVLERLFPGLAARREPVARAMDALSRGGLALVPAFRPVLSGGYALRAEGWDWMAAPYVPGEPLPQPEYVADAPRGQALAVFLGELDRLGPEASHGLSDDFSLPAYADELLETIRVNRPGLVEPLGPVREALAPLDEAWDGLPRTLAHGDFHPLNVIWRDAHPTSVIDWEFCGLRPRLYDAANMLGCVGSEDPAMLGSGLALAFVRGLRNEGVLRAEDEPWLPLLFLGLRFAWLSEWLRRSDEDMIDMELTYMRLILNNLDGLARVWAR